VKGSSGSKGYLGECVCDTLFLSHTCMHIQAQISLFLRSQPVRCEAVQIPWLGDHRAGPE